MFNSNKKWFLFIIMIIGLVVAGCSTERGGSESNEEGNEEAGTDYPSKSIKLVVPYSAGGGTDTVARATSEYIDLEESIVVSNVEGSGGVVGTNEVTDAEPDGHTLLLTSVTAIVSGFHAGIYDSKIWQELEPVVSLVSQSGGIVVQADSEWDTIDDLIAYAEDNPKELKVGMPGIGGGGHIISEVFIENVGIEVNYVPFDGSADARAALAGGHIDVMAGFVSEFSDFVQDGKFNMLVSTGSERSSKFPDVPTFEDIGIDFVLDHRNGIFAPKGTPEDVIEKLGEQLREVTENEEFIELMEGLDTESDFLSAEEFQQELEKLDATIEPVGPSIKQ